MSANLQEDKRRSSTKEETLQELKAMRQQTNILISKLEADDDPKHSIILADDPKRSLSNIETLDPAN